VKWAAIYTSSAKACAWSCSSGRRKTASDLACPHGVQFYDLAQADERSERAAWSYEAPRPAMQQVDHWVGFWEDVEIV
jgi:uncharacterized protein (DUF427 family)